MSLVHFASRLVLYLYIACAVEILEISGFCESEIRVVRTDHTHEGKKIEMYCCSVMQTMFRLTMILFIIIIIMKYSWSTRF